MKMLLVLLIFSFNTLHLISSELYINSFGDKNDKTIIYLHGGPGYNSVLFEYTAAEELSKNGFFVIVYDRRGEGRSPDKNAKYNFDEVTNDIMSIYEKFNIQKATLIGHSFGGILAIKFAEKHIDKIDNIIFVGATINLQETFKSIISKSKKLYQEKNDNVNSRYILMIEGMDKASIEYSSYCFMHAMQNGFYSPKTMTEDTKSIYQSIAKDSIFKIYSSKLTTEPVTGYWKNEKYTTLDLREKVIELSSKYHNIFGIYGKEDGLFSTEQVEELSSIIGKDNLIYLDNCSHNPYIDNRKLFIDTLNKWIK